MVPKAPLALFIVVLMAAPAVAEQSEDSEISFVSLRELHVDREYRLSGYEMDVLQNEIDEAGDDDGRVEAFDIDEWLDWKVGQETGRVSPDHVLDGHTGTVVAWTAYVSDALGSYDTRPDNRVDADDEDEMVLRVVETIAFDVDDDGTHTYYLPAPTRDSAFEFQVPPGHAIIATEGLTDEVSGQAGQSVRGDSSAATAVRIDFQRSGELVGLPTLADLVGPDAKLGGTTTELDWTTDIRVTHYTITGELAGLDAVGLRGLIDQEGNGDGIVTIEEADDVLDRYVRGRLGSASSTFIMGGAPATIASIEIVADGIEGPVGTQNAIGIESSGVITFAVPESATELSLIIAKTARNSRISIELPEGFAVADDGTDGLRGMSYSDARRSMTADEIDGEAVRVSFTEAYSFAGFRLGQWLSVVLGLAAMVGVIVFLAVTDRRISRVTHAVEELEQIQRHYVHGPPTHGPRDGGRGPQ